MRPLQVLDQNKGPEPPNCFRHKLCNDAWKPKLPLVPFLHVYRQNSPSSTAFLRLLEIRAA